MLNGNTLTSINGDHSTGEPQASGERADDVESMFLEFFGLQRMNANQTYENWAGTDGGGSTVNNDPEYKLCVHSNTHVSIALVGTC